MRERPILFSAPMVRAILEGRKTQTRRVIKPQPEWREREENRLSAAGWAFETPRFTLRHWPDAAAFAGQLAQACPYGQTGDRLWVRETAKADYSHDWPVLGQYVADNAHVVYPGPEVDENGEDDYGGSCVHWWYKRDTCPAIHLPRKFSRIDLEITGVRVERLQDISEADAAAEGAEEPSLVPILGAGWSSRDMFAKLWRSINGPECWDANPWVWVVESRRAEAQARAA